MLSGLLLVDKPLGISSHAVVSMARRALGEKKIGHAGTLDPLASGLLVLGVGSGTRFLTFCVGLDKTYLATMRLGYATTTDDAEGERMAVTGGSLATCTAEAIDDVVARFTGTISQVPSAYSAIKVDGVRAYEKARKGESVDLAARQVQVYRIERGSIAQGDGFLDVELIIECSSGTYIRALARDIGQELGVGGHLVRLRRSAVGPFGVHSAVSADAIAAETVVPLERVVSDLMPVMTVKGPARDDIRHGRTIPCEAGEPGPWAVVDAESGDLLAVIECSSGRSRILMGVPSV